VTEVFRYRYWSIISGLGEDYLDRPAEARSTEVVDYSSGVMGRDMQGKDTLDTL
jgi:hypothetical protein